MADFRLALSLLAWMLIASIDACATLAGDALGAPDARASDGLLKLSATILLPDGSPAPGAVIELHNRPDRRSRLARANDSGRVDISDLFGNGASIHASSADGTCQTTLMISAGEVHSAFAAPLTIELVPAGVHDVVVTAHGEPAAGVEVAVVGHGFRVCGVTGSGGKCRLLVPADGKIQAVVAWHPEWGVDGVRDWRAGIQRTSTELSLRDPAPHTIRVTDTEGRPVAGLELGTGFSTTQGDVIPCHEIESAHVRTDDNGEARVPWAPARDLKYVHSEILGAEWKEDETNQDQVAEGITTVRVRRKLPVVGRLVMPEGVSAEGILVTGFGFGPASSGSTPYARARADGTFTMDVASAHGYIIGVSDLEWASDLWSGVILASDADHPREINIKAYPATPLTFCVTRGSNRERVANAWFHIARNGEVAHVDQSGEVETGISGVREWLRTGADGVARAGVGRGAVEVRLSNGEWQETRTIEISSAEPQEIEFHRNWEGRRRLTARLKLNGSDFAASPKMVIRAWTSHDDRGFTVHQPAVRDDGTIDVAFDEETIALLVFDPDKQLSAFSQFVVDESSVELTMQPAATCSGTVMDENGRPLANRGLRLVVTRSLIDVLEPQKTDDMGRFRFTAVPVNAPLRLSIVNEQGVPEYTLFDGERLFEPREQRLNEVLRPIRTDSQ